jgi:hypothetical protein
MVVSTKRHSEWDATDMVINHKCLKSRNWESRIRHPKLSGYAAGFRPLFSSNESKGYTSLCLTFLLFFLELVGALLGSKAFENSFYELNVIGFPI